MSKQFIVFLLLLLCYCSYKVEGQIRIQGKIIDNSTQEAIPGVSLQILGQKTGVLTNEDGEFIIKASKLPLSILVSHLSYGKKQIEVTNNEFLNIKLNLSAISLPEFSTGNPAVALLRAAIKNAEADSAKVYNFNAYYQMTSRFKGKFTKLQEMFFEVAWTTKGVKKWIPKNTRYAQKDYQGFRTKNQLAEAFIYVEVYKKYLVFPLNNANITENYKFSIKEVLNENTDEEIVVVRCVPKEKRKTSQLRFEGDIYVYSKSRKIARILGAYTTYSKKWKNEKKIDLSFAIGIKTIPYYLHLIDISTRRNGLATNQENIWLYFKEEIPSLSRGKPYTRWEVKDDDEFFKNMPYDDTFWSKADTPLKHPDKAEEVLKYIVKKDNHSTNISK